jgi:hypothetical protein
MISLERLKIELKKRAHFDFKDEDIDNNIKILAVGDSWFDYPLVSDIVDHLREMKYAVYKKSKIGNTLEDIVFGTKYSFSYKNKGQTQLKETIKAIEENNPRFIIFSAGGNDIVGEQMQLFLNHKKSGLPLVRHDVLDYLANTTIKNAIEYFYLELIKIKPDIEFITHGYDYGFPSGKSFHGIVGPWILPTMAMKGITDFETQREIIVIIVDKFNTLLAELENKYENFHHIDIRNMFTDEILWHNEIHLKTEGYLKVARKFHEKIIQILKYNPVEKFSA